MKINDVDLKLLRGALEDTLSIYCAQLGVKFNNFEDLALTPEKPNSARTVIHIKYDSVPVGEIYVLAFVKGDGTGDSKTYKLNNLIIPREFRHKEKPERVIPRSKKGVMAEAFLPLFSIAPNGYLAVFASCLDELSIDGDNKIVSIGRLGLNNFNYSKALKRKLGALPRIYATVEEYIDGQRYGDPHSVYYNRSTEDALQVVGFLGIKDENNPLMRDSRFWSSPLSKD